jgi:hypothetical protein
MSAGNPEAHKTSKISIALSEESSRPNQGTMANSDFWRGLTDQFLAVRGRLRAGEFTDFIYREFEVLAGRGARELFSASESESVPNLLAVWLDASKEERLASRSSSQSSEVASREDEVFSAEDHAQKLTMGTLNRLCEASIIFCKGLENKALQAEFKERFAQSRAKQSPTVTRTPQTRKRSNNERESCVRPLLETKGWSINDWAVNSRVDFHTADRYLKNKSKPFASTLKKLADSLEVPVARLPK